jgi:hypothetical protein
MTSDVLEMYFDNRQSIPQVSAATGINRSMVRKIIIASGRQIRSRTEGVRLASDRIAAGHTGKKYRKWSNESRARLSMAKKKWADEYARGYRFNSNGHVEYTRGENKGRSEHVVYMERKIGRRLSPEECVHHIDGNTRNNNRNNLALMTRSGHARLHRLFDKASGKERERLSNGRFC